MGQHVLVPVDGSSQSEKAFKYALNELPDAQITLVHVLKMTTPWAYGGDESFDLEGYRDEQERRRKNAEAMLEELKDEASAHGGPIDTKLVVGGAANGILETAEDHDVDHIVMGSHGRSGVGRVLFGSVAETVTRRSTVPVTIVR